VKKKSQNLLPSLDYYEKKQQGLFVFFYCAALQSLFFFCLNFAKKTPGGLRLKHLADCCKKNTKQKLLIFC